MRGITNCRNSSNDPNLLVVFTGKTWPLLVIAPPGNVMLFSRNACETWNSETRSARSRSGSTVMETCCSTSPITSMLAMPSIPESLGRILVSSISCNSTDLPVARDADGASMESNRD